MHETSERRKNVLRKAASAKLCKAIESADTFCAIFVNAQYVNVNENACGHRCECPFFMEENVIIASHRKEPFQVYHIAGKLQLIDIRGE